MIAAETREGLERLGIIQATTLPYSPYQNAKQEVFWSQVEGRLLAMLEGVAADLRLDFLNEATQAWVELEYHRAPHTETGETPLARFLAGPDVLRASPPTDAFRAAFTTEQVRTQRRSDGTLTVAGIRFEVPARFAHLPRLSIRYASVRSRPPLGFETIEQHGAVPVQSGAAFGYGRDRQIRIVRPFEGRPPR